MTNTKKTKTDADRFKELVDSLNSLKLLTSQAEQHRYLFRDIARNLRALIIRKKSKNFKPLLLDLASKREYSLCVYVMDLKIQEQLDKENPDIVISNFSGLMMLEPNEHPAFNTALELSEALEKVMVDKVFRMDDFISIKELLEQFGDKEAAHFDLEIPSDLVYLRGHWFEDKNGRFDSREQVLKRMAEITIALGTRFCVDYGTSEYHLGLKIISSSQKTRNRICMDA